MNAKHILTSNNWNDFKTALKPLIDKEKGNAFEELTRLYLETEPTFSTKIKKVWHHSEIPQKIVDELGLVRPEIGVDLLALIKDGSYWAIQCKYHGDQTRNVSLSEISTFFNVTDRPNTYSKISHRLVCTSANEISRNVQKLYSEKLGYLTSADFSKLGKTEFDYFRDKLNDGDTTIAPFHPKPHQSIAIKKCISFFEDKKNTRGKIIHPCGSGKSLTGYWISQELKSKTILLAVPSLALVRQTLSTWTREAVANDIDMDWIAVCSDEDVKSSDDPLMQKVDLGIEVNTDPQVVADFLCKKRMGSKVVVTTYQSGAVVSEGLKKSGKTFDLGIFDEAHKTVGQKDKRFAHLLYEENAQVVKRVFMTATERQFKGNSDEYLSMDDPEVYGTMIDELSFKAALEQKEPILSDYKVVTMLVSKSEIKKIIKDNNFVKSDGSDWTFEGDASTFAALISLRKLIDKHNIKHTVSFHNSIKRSKDFQKLNFEISKTNNFGKLSSFHVSGKDSTGARASELERFVETEPSLITNARCLNEGVDVPAIDAVLFADAKQSKIDIVQAAGRALRKFDGKEYGYIIIPVIANDDVLNTSDDIFNQIINVISALGMNDSRIIEEYKLIVNGISIPNPIIEINAPKIANINFKELMSNIDIEIWNRLSFGWGKGFKRLEEYVDKYHNAFVPNHFTNDDGFRLGSWVQNRRHWFKKGKLSQDHIQQLESIDGWEWNVLEAKFEKGFEQLKKFIDKNHHARVVKDFTDDDGFELGTFVSHQRANFKKGALSKKRVNRLESLKGWIWYPLDENFLKGIKVLQHYTEKNGSAKFLKHFIFEGVNLLQWTSTQRVLYRQGKLTKDRIQKLESIEGWVWDPDEERFQEGFIKLQEFSKKNNHCRAPSKIDEEGFNLGSWANSRRQNFKKGILSQERIQKLESLEGWVWDPSEESFKKGFKGLKKYLKKYKTLHVPEGYIDKDGTNLNEWISSVRKSYKKGNLSLERINLLESLDGWVWNTNDDKFDKGLVQLKKYVKKFGSAEVNASFKDDSGYYLGAWVLNKRQAYRLGKLSKNRIEELESFKNWRWHYYLKEDYDRKFEKKITEFRKFFSEHGDKRIPRKENTYELSKWVFKQRAEYRLGVLSQERIQKLESLEGWVWNRHDLSFKRGFAQLQKHEKNKKSLRVVRKYVDKDGFKLGNYIGKLRTDYKNGKLSSDKIKKLESIEGWVWDVHEEAFKRGFAQLQKHEKDKKSLRVVKKYVDKDGFKLGNWIGTQRGNYKKGILSLDKIKQLESVEGWVWEYKKKK